MGLSIENAFKIIESTDYELLELRRKARETQQDVTGLTPDQTERLQAFDNVIYESSIVSEFDIEQQQIIHPEMSYSIPETTG